MFLAAAAGMRGCSIRLFPLLMYVSLGCNIALHCANADAAAVLVPTLFAGS
jgi:hypothetical protein